MTIEEKLDWILDKLRTGEYYKKEEQYIMKELYPVITPIDFKLRLEYDTEWTQLINKLYEDGLIDENTADFKPFVLTLKGKMFRGYVRQKQNENLKYYLRIAHLVILLLATVAAGYYGLFEIWKYYFGYVPK
jgi:hypothetical protein